MTAGRWLAAAVVAATIVGVASPTSAHPQGTKPVALVRAVGPTELEVLWVVASDDFAALLGAHGFESHDDNPDPAVAAVAAYFRSRVVVSNRGAPCPQRIAGAGLAGPGVAVSLRFACGSPLAQLEITLTLLQDVSTDYVTIIQAGTPSGPARGAFSAAVPTVRLDFAATVASVEPVATGTARPEGRMGRIVASLQDQPGGTSFVAALALALLLGALHALTPGHGKTLTAAYVVGAGGTTRQALGLGGIVSATHAASVGILGAVAISLDRLFLPSDWVPWTEVLAGILTIVLGVTLVRVRRHDHAHAGRADAKPWRRLAAVGFVGGLIPSPEALGVLLVASSIGRWQAGMALVLAFSMGLAAVVLGIAVLAVRGRTVIGRIRSGSLLQRLPYAAALIVVGLGLFITVRGLSRL